MSYIVGGMTYYTVRFLNYGATDLLGTADVEAGGDATSLAPTPEVIEGLKFAGWNVPITNVTEDMTVRPTYESNVTTMYTVRFLNRDGTDVWSTQQVEEGADADPPVPEVLSGYIFIGWSTSFSDVHADTTVYPRYREVPPHPTLKFYKKNADETSGSLIKSYSGVNACTIVRKLDGECTLGFKIITRQIDGYVSMKDRVEVDGLVFYLSEIKKNISSGICYTEMNAEHISYILNNDDYKVTAFDMTGTPRTILKALFAGTPFTVGTVDFTESVTLRVNKEATRRACVMQLIALLGGEIEYNGYTIGIRSHIGSISRIDVMKKASVQDISYTYNVSEDTTNYSLSLYQKGSLDLGDELKLKFTPLGINEDSRIVGMDWNPFNYKEVNITVGAYIPTLNDTLYELVNEVSDIRETTAKYTVEFGEMIGNGTFYFTRAYSDRPYFQVTTNDGSTPTVKLNKKSGSAFAAYVGATLSGVNSSTSTLLVFYCTVPNTEDD